jgi:excisionase family DNA binding protein
MDELILIQKQDLEKIIYKTVQEAITDAQKSKKIKSQMNIKEAAEYLSISVPTLNRKKDDGIIPFVKVGGRIIFIRKDLDEYLTKNKSTATKTVTSWAGRL